MLRTSGLALIAALLGGMPAAASDLKVFGALEGEVRNTAGIAQMGASVVLFNNLEQPIRKTYTGADGKFRFDAISPAHDYSVRVSLNSYVPASRNNIPVRAGMASYLSIQLATIFSTIELIYTTPSESGVVSDEWKWVLRSSSATRPVLRLMPELEAVLNGRPPAREHKVFSGTRGLMRVSAGDNGLSSTLGNEPDLGTAFALATSIFGGNEVRVSGNLGYASSTGVPATGFRTRYSRTTPDSLAPDVEVTLRQVQMRHRAGQAFASGSPDGAPMLRTMSVKLSESRRILDNLSMDYGMLMESVVFLDRMNLMSPFARLTYDLGPAGAFEVGYSSGAPALDLIASSTSETGIQNDLLGLAMFPRVSLVDGGARVQRSTNYEIGYRKTKGSRTYSAGLYHERVGNAAITMAAPAGVFTSADLLPDIASNSSIFNLGTYDTYGYMGAFSQDLGAGWTAAVGAGMGGALQPLNASVPFEDAAALRSRFTVTRREWVSVRTGGTVPGSRTRVLTTYIWTPGGSLAPAHAWLTQRWQPQMGLNVQLRQPLPAVSLMPGHWEMTADLRNLLAQGYVPVASSDGRSVYLIQFPRSVRGGLSFIF